MRWFYTLAALLFALTGIAMAQPPPTPTAAPSPTAAPTPPGGDAIKLTGCSLEVGGFSGIAAKLHVDFTNLTTEPLTHVRFRVEAGVSTFAVMDIGTFTPNVKIHHDLDPPPARVTHGHSTLPNFAGGLGCAVDAYTLQSGYTWVSPELQKELTQSPTGH